MKDEDPEVKEIYSIPLPDARTAFQLRSVKDCVYGTTYAWDIVQEKYWPVFKLMEEAGRDIGNDRNGVFIHWVLDRVPGSDPESLKYRNEIHRRVNLSFLDPDRKEARAIWSNENYFDGLEGSSVIWAKDVEEREIEWLWPGRIPLGKQTTLAGPGGVGKSFLLCDVAARVSAGMEWPFSGGELAAQGNVLYISGEDDVEDTLVPRLRLQGADLGRVAFLSPNELQGFCLSAPKFLETAAKVLEDMKEVKLVILDPPTSFLAGIDENSNAEVRGFLTPMKEWAHANRCSIVFNSHVNKAAGKKLDVQQRVIGSVAMVNGPRAAHMVTVSEDDSNIKLFVPLKMNLWERLPALSFRIVRDLHEIKQARLEWVAEVDIDAGDAVNGRESKGDRDAEEKITNVLRAERWVVEKFRFKKTWQSKELLEWAEEELGPDQATAVKNARIKLGIQSKKVGPNWVCWVSDDWQHGK